MTRLLLFACAALILAGCARTPGGGSDAPELDVLREWMIGDFDNTPALADDERNAIEAHFPIEVHLREIPNIENALYIEQAAMANSASPYRQRVYLLRRDGDAYISEVWTIANEERYANAYLQPAILEELGMDDLTQKEGCEVVLYWDGAKFVGGTVGTDCASSLNGSSYATAEVVVHANGFSSFDRGYTAEGEQVWGAVELPYEFTRRAP